MDYKRVIALLMFLIMSISFAGDIGQASSAIKDVLCQIQSLLKTIIPVVAFVLILAAGVVYAAGQLMGAETRARAVTWSTAMLIGAFIGVLIVVLVPPILNALLSSSGVAGNIESVCA